MKRNFVFCCKRIYFLPEVDIKPKTFPSARINFLFCRTKKECSVIYSRSNTEKSSPYSDQYNVEQNQNSVSKIREALPQFCAVGAKNLLLLTFGTSLGFPTILIPELRKENPEIFVTLEELTWIS